MEQSQRVIALEQALAPFNRNTTIVKASSEDLYAHLDNINNLRHMVDHDFINTQKVHSVLSRKYTVMETLNMIDRFVKYIGGIPVFNGNETDYIRLIE
jgi:hypothetical protein